MFAVVVHFKRKKTIQMKFQNLIFEKLLPFSGLIQQMTNIFYFLFFLGR